MPLLCLSEGRAFSAQGKELQMSACSVMHHCFIQELEIDRNSVADELWQALRFITARP